jgi:hypothetical protein
MGLVSLMYKHLVKKRRKIRISVSILFLVWFVSFSFSFSFAFVFYFFSFVGWGALSGSKMYKPQEVSTPKHRKISRNLIRRNDNY